MSTNSPDRRRRVAEDLLFSGPQREGFAKALFRGEFQGDLLFPDPGLSGAEARAVEQAGAATESGRIALGARCTRGARVCLAAAAHSAAQTGLNGQPFADMEWVQGKLAYLAAITYAMEATTSQTAILLDRGEDVMLEAAILKVFCAEALWKCIHETLQVQGAEGCFQDESFDLLMMRDARAGTITEGTNEGLLVQIGAEGVRELGLKLTSALEGFKRPGSFVPALWSFSLERMRRIAHPPVVPVRSHTLRPTAAALGRRCGLFARAVERVILVHRDRLLQRQFVLARISRAAIALYSASCTLARLDAQLQANRQARGDQEAAELYLDMAFRQFDASIVDLSRNNDPATIAAANTALARFS